MVIGSLLDQYIFYSPGVWCKIKTKRIFNMNKIITNALNYGYLKWSSINIKNTLKYWYADDNRTIPR